MILGTRTMFLASLGLTSLATATSPAMANVPKIDWMHDEAMAVARGYDSVTGEVRGDCIVNSKVLAPSGADGQISRYELKLVEKSVDLEKSLDITAAASARAFIFGASSKTKFISSKNVSTLSTFVIIRMQVLNPSRAMIKPKIEPLLLDVLKNEGPASFREKCGDYFVAGYTSGAEFIAILKLDSANQTEKEALNVGLKVNMGIFNSSAEFSKTFQSMQYKAKSELIVLQSGGLGVMKDPQDPSKTITKKAPTTLDEIQQRASEMPNLALEHPIPIAPTLRPYDEIAAYVALTEEPLDLSIQEEFISRVSIDIQRERNNLFALNNILYSNLYRLDPKNSRAYYQARHNATVNLNQLRSAYVYCSNMLFDSVDTTPCQATINLAPSSYVIPSLK